MKKTWWKEAVVYQIYPRSFMDSNDDGIGDINGIISKLDYLKDLGVDVIWLCPIYKSPNDDNGYDISDYQDIMDEFGTMSDFDKLLKEVHERGLKLIMDLVINHTSDKHPWFLESKSSIRNSKRNWYIWKEPNKGKEPNNWESIFSGSTWEFDEQTNQYYFHVFSKRQPDLNWHNSDVRDALFEMINWWLEKGIDGFRVDAITHINKEASFSDIPNPDNLKYVPSFEKHMNLPGIHELLKELKDRTYGKYDVMTVGEANGVRVEDNEDLEAWVGEQNGKFDMIFQFEHLQLWQAGKKQSLNILKLKETLTKWQNRLHNKGWNALFIENHDQPRRVSTWGNDNEFWYESATALATLYFLMEGTPFIYQGQEIGMTNSNFKTIDEYDDIVDRNLYKYQRSLGYSNEEIMSTIREGSRDNSRTPMQWSGNKNAGFSRSEPWLKVNSNYKKINVQNQQNNECSVLNYYKSLIRLRKSESALVYGEYQLIMENDERIYAYVRSLKDVEILILINLTDKEASFNIEFNMYDSELLLANIKTETMNVLNPFEARIYKISKSGKRGR